MRFTRRVSIALTGVVMVGGLVTATSGSASAAAAACPTYDTALYIYNDSGLAGYALWNANPTACENGDNLGAWDTATDGYSVVAHLRKPDGSVADRVVTTSGHNAPYIAWKGGDLPEGNTYWMWGCLSKNGVESHCTDVYDVTA